MARNHSGMYRNEVNQDEMAWDSRGQLGTNAVYYPGLRITGIYPLYPTLGYGERGPLY